MTGGAEQAVAVRRCAVLIGSGQSVINAIPPGSHSISNNGVVFRRSKLAEHWTADSKII
jgi:hypothetical protein